MAKTFDSKIRELEKEKSELDLSFLQLQKKEYEKKLSDLLSNPDYVGNVDIAITKYDEARECFAEISLLDSKIQHLPETHDEERAKIDERIDFYKKEREKIQNFPLYKDTDEGIAEILGTDSIYQYLVEKGNTKAIEKMKQRKLSTTEYNIYREKIYGALFDELSSKKTGIELPEGMSEEIRELLSGCEEFKRLSADEVEDFLKKELKKNNGHINDKHIRNKFKNNVEDYKAAYNLIKYLTTKYSQFTIFKETTKKSATDIPGKSKNDKLVEEAFQYRSGELEQDKIKSEKLLNLAKLGKIEDVKERCQKYIDLFEELGCKFDNKSDFLQQLINVIDTRNHTQFDNGIQNILSKIIHLNLKPEKSEGKGYLSYKLSPSYDARRIIAYPNGEIFTICQHDQYEEIINKKPPIGKRRK